MLWSFLYRALCGTFQLLALRVRSSEWKEVVLDFYLPLRSHFGVSNI